MSTDFGELKEVNIRDAWADEARDFTPWLARNLDRLGEALGIRMELQAVEHRVEQYTADIVARDTLDDSIVLIENQLELTDHKHLGQILTYVAGVDARTVVWIAKDFASPHVAAIEWLNERTIDDYRFFAVRLKAVRIGNSPLAPVFDVVCQPNEWTRTARATTGGDGSRAHLVILRREFWSFYIDRFPDANMDGRPNGTVDRWHIIPRALGHIDLCVVILFNTQGVGVYLRGRRGVPESDIFEHIESKVDELIKRTGAEIVAGSKGNYIAISNPFTADDVNDRSRWPVLADWCHEHATRLEQTVKDLYG